MGLGFVLVVPPPVPEKSGGGVVAPVGSLGGVGVEEEGRGMLLLPLLGADPDTGGTRAAAGVVRPGGGGRGGKPPLPSPWRMLLVSRSRWWARSCWPRDTSVKARVSMSEVRSSMRRCTTEGCGGMGGVAGRADRRVVPADNMVMARSEGRGSCVAAPSRRMSL